jgi:hypothetical protein
MAYPSHTCPAIAVNFPHLFIRGNTLSPSTALAAAILGIRIGLERSPFELALPELYLSILTL